MKKILSILVVAAALSVSSCQKEDALNPTSVFTDDSTYVENDFDVWLKANYVDTYNLKFNYRLDDKETDMEYNLIPTSYDRAVAMAKFAKYLWFDVYKEIAGQDFVNMYAPKVIQLVGSPAYNADAGSIVLGTAEGGLKVTLYNVNSLDLDNIDIETMNYWFFKTMHHEFCHILHQTKSYNQDFNLIAPETYVGGSWVNLSDKEALDMGFVSPYASSEYQEAFVETFAIYVTSTPEAWAKLLSGASEVGLDLLNQRFAIVEDFLQTSWNINIHELRDLVQERSAKVETWTKEDLAL